MDRRLLVLVVDDDQDILELTRILLEREGWDVITATDGVEAIERAFERLPDAIVLDVMMPRMNGFQVCRLLKSDPETSGIPIVICTVRSLESDKIYARTAGADHYLVKPYDNAELVAIIRRVAAEQQPRERPPEETRRRKSADDIITDVNRLLDRRLMELTLLHYLTRAMTGTLHLDAVLGVVLQSLVTDLGFTGGMIFLLGEEGLLEERVPHGHPLRIDTARHELFAKVMERNEVTALAVADLVREAPAELCVRIGAPTAVLVPIQAKGRSIGLFVLESSAAALDREQRDFLLTLASQSGLAIENANLYARTLQLSITDGLTGIFNYRHFCERLDLEIARSRRYGVPLGLLLIDIDRFKSFNDRFGHLLGDEVLRVVAHRVRSNTRDVDVVARYGGEEFGVILQEVDETEIVGYAERIREAVAAAEITGPGGEPIGVTVSVGAAVSSGGSMSMAEFIRRADTALYRAKEEGRDRVWLWAGPPDAAPGPSGSASGAAAAAEGAGARGAGDDP